MATGRYYRVTPRFWQDRDVRSWPEDSRWLAVYLISSPHRNMTGLFYCPLTYMQSDLQWPANRLQKAFEGLVQAGFIEYDKDAEVVLITNALKHDSPGNENQVKGAVNALLTVPETYLLARLLELAGKHSERLADGIRKAFEGLSKEIRNTVSVSVPVTVEEHTSTPADVDLPDHPAPLTPEAICRLWNDLCGDLLSRVDKRIPPGRRAKLKSRAAEPGRTESWWSSYFLRIRNSPHCCGESPPAKGASKPWKATLDWAVRSEDVVTRVLEGQYGSRPQPPPPRQPYTLPELTDTDRAAAPEGFAAVKASLRGKQS
jgi:hypothetical protein